MRKKQFVYVFVGGGKILWSSDTAESLIGRGESPHDIKMLKDFVEKGSVGSFNMLETGEMFFRTA
jgi:hypothetical protein